MEHSPGDVGTEFAEPPDSLLLVAEMVVDRGRGNDVCIQDDLFCQEIGRLSEKS